jgi:hypothetical protein
VTPSLARLIGDAKRDHRVIVVNGAEPTRSSQGPANPQHNPSVPNNSSPPASGKTALFEKLEANSHWTQRDSAVLSSGTVQSATKREKTSQKRLKLHFNVWYKNLKNYFPVPPIPQTLRGRTEYQGPRSVSSMYHEAAAWAEAMIRVIEATRARGNVSTFTDAEFDLLVAYLGWEGLLRRVDPDLRASINPAPPPPST